MAHGKELPYLFPADSAFEVEDSAVGHHLALSLIHIFIVGFLESFRARNKMNKNPKFILTVSAIAILAFAVILILNLNL